MSEYNREQQLTSGADLEYGPHDDARGVAQGEQQEQREAADRRGAVVGRQVVHRRLVRHLAETREINKRNK